MNDPVLLIHACSTLMMTGLIWFVQVVHYPLMARVGRDGFSAYEQSHTQRTTWVVGPLMFAEFGSAAWIALQGTTLSIIGITLLVLVWVSTFAIQVPAHAKLSSGFDEQAHRVLVRSNWIRTVFWSARGVIALAML